MPILSANGLAISQPMRVDNDRTILITKLIHDSGEELISEMILPHNPDPQKFGSLITYYKRYQLQAILGVSTKDEDDDGNSVSTSAFRNEVKPPYKPEPPNPMPGLASDAQKNALRNMKIEFDNDITKQEASELIAKNSKRN